MQAGELNFRDSNLGGRREFVARAGRIAAIAPATTLLLAAAEMPASAAPLYSRPAPPAAVAPPAVVNPGPTDAQRQLDKGAGAQEKADRARDIAEEQQEKANRQLDKAERGRPTP
jgi:hypothetical protein